MMITTPSAPGGAAAADTTLPGAAIGGAAPSPAAGAPEGVAESTGLAPLFAQLLNVASLAVPAGMAAAQPAVTLPGGAGADSEPATEQAVEEGPVDVPLAAMMPAFHFAMPPVAQPQAAAAFTAAGALPAAGGGQARAGTLLAGAADSARQAAADAITAMTTGTTGAAAAPLMARLLGGALPAGAAAPAQAGAEPRQPASTSVGSTAATPATSAAAPAVLAAQDGAQAGQEGQSGQPQGGDQGSFRGVMAASAPVAGAAAPADTVKLAGSPEQWQQPLRAALGDRLQLNLQKGNDQAVIRLEPPNLGSIEISIRQTAGALHVSMSATHSEVVRQLNAVGDSMRQDLSQRQMGDVAVTVTQSSRSLADSEGRGRQPQQDAEQQRQERGPGRSLNEGDYTNPTFAMLRE